MSIGMNVTAIVPARDEEHNIVDCLQSLGWTDRRVVFLDSRTADRTATLSKELGAEVMLGEFENFAQFHNAAMDRVEADWILFVDADERATPELAQEVRMVTDGSHREVAWAVPRHNYIFGRLTLGAGWYPDYQSRLLLRDRVRWERPVHEVIVTDGPQGYLKNALIHYNYDDLSDFIARQDKYSNIDAGILFEQGICPRFYTPYSQAMRHFWWRFITLRGSQDGFHGLWLSLLMAYYEAIKYRRLARLWREGMGVVDDSS